MIIGLGLSSETKFVIGFLLVGLGPSIPVLGVVFNISITSYERFAFVDSDYFDNLGPLIDDIALFISLNYG